MDYTYRFEIPVEVSYCVDESNLSIESIKDLRKLEKKHDIDLEFVIDEYECKVEIEEESMDEDEEYIGIAKDEIFDSVIVELWDEILEILNTDIKLSKLDESIANKIFKLTCESFNNGHLEKYFHKEKSFNIKSMLMNDLDIQNSKFYVDVTIDRELNDNEIDVITRYIDGQCSDGWGEGFEQQDISKEVNEDEMYVYVKTWKPESDVKFVK